MATNNLGLARAIQPGTIQPQNTRLIWYDENPGEFIHKVYNIQTNQWEPLGNNSSGSIEYVQKLSDNSAGTVEESFNELPPFVLEENSFVFFLYRGRQHVFVGGAGNWGSGGQVAEDTDFILADQSGLKAVLRVTVPGFEIPVGTEYMVGTDMEVVIRDLLATYQQPSFSSFSISFSPSTNQPILGQVLDIGDATIGFNNDSDGNPPSNVQIAGEGFDGVSIPDGDTTVSPIPDSEISKDGPGDVESWVLSGEGNEGVIPTRTVNKTWFNQHLFGAGEFLDGSDSGAVTALLTLLQQKIPLNTKVTTKTCTPDNEDLANYTYIAHDEEYGDINNIIQNGSIPVLGAFTNIGNHTFNNVNGVGRSFTVYRSNSAGAFADGTTLAIT